ncbi:DNA polymerase III subunit delta [Verrucomicrobiaceae bacterium R5-34]|uniref:DNA polymerase III subunit delta n=1 Tax=Oceaniferula flava TaxID=2800421 RepID=A0AAE2SCG9_9BACT|nr:DNA polymerase III subunit delta [Oceaniferula flavus]MBK1831149.1 DNA polymerase III subunit delta [Verrucomicrobiaceae bacterium R5-34]MBK1855665.1 DNA polymerase III subunit delta [Oceaniferula flavus]MBM1136971.1 DNA polymerase III subunit delta [Oceaniferula flavus]
MSQIYVITGSDEGTVSEEALKTFEKIKPEGGDDFSNEIINGTIANADEAHSACSQVIQSLQTVPFFGGGKTVWLKNATFLGSDRTSEAEATKKGVEALLDCLQAGISSDITLLISCTALDKRRAFYKYLKKEAKLDIYDKPDVSRDGWQDQVARLVRNKATELGLSFQGDALELFVMLAGEDTRQINSELEKIDLYLGDRREVTEEDVRLMVPLSRAGVVFEIGNAIQKKNGSRAIELVDQQLARKETAVGILRASIIPTVRNLFMAAAACDGKNIPTGNYNSFSSALDSLPSHERAWLPQKKAGGVNAYPLFLASKSVRNFGLPKLRKAMEAALDADRALVTSGLDQRVVLHRLIATLCS